VPYLVNGVRISSGLSVIGAIVGEFFASYGRDRFGLGYLIQATSGLLDTATLFAAILASTALGLTIFGAVTLVGNVIVARWKE
jgi:NitT/TauT family transport system permease protein